MEYLNIMGSDLIAERGLASIQKKRSLMENGEEYSQNNDAVSF